MRSKRNVLLRALAATAFVAWLAAAGMATAADSLTPLDVAYAGSMGAVMDGGVRAAVAKALGAQLRGRAQGSMGLARLIEAGSIRPDVFISVTPGPMQVVLDAHKAAAAAPFARTEMCIAYSPRSRFAKLFAKSGEPGARQWWEILETRGIRFGRTDPVTDPQGLNIIFTMKLAAEYYRQPNLADLILGPNINREQIFQEPEVMSRLQAGQLDASSAYKTQPGAMKLPYISLPKEINLGDAELASEYGKVSVVLHGKTLKPAPLVFYATALSSAARPELAQKFVTWLTSDDGRAVFAAAGYDPPGAATPLAPAK
jgi:molybdate/tungstate transport system substrate-binding protein